jgi:hypothetical protein
MVESRLPHRGLVLLGRAFRDRANGVLSLGRGAIALRLVLRDGHICAVVFPDDTPRPPLPAPGPDDSAQVRLERVLSEIGIRPTAPKSGPGARRSLRERMLAGLLDTDETAPSFERGATAPAGAIEVAGATEALILEAVRRVPDPHAVGEGLGDLDQRLVPTAGVAEERTLTLTEGYILSHVDGLVTARQVLQMVPLEREEKERTLLGLLLTGRLEYRAAAPAGRTREALVANPREPIGAGPRGHGVATGPEEVVSRPHEAAEPQSVEPQSVQPQSVQPQSVEPQSVEPQSVEPQPVEPQPVEPLQPVESLAAEREQPASLLAGKGAPEPAAIESPHVRETATADTAGGDSASEEPAEPPRAQVAATPADVPPEPDAPAAAAAPAHDAARVEGEPPVPPATAEAAGPPASEDAPDANAPPETAPPAATEADPAVLERRREVLEYFEALPKKNHFEVLGVEPGCTSADVKRAYAALARKYHPDMHRRGGLDDLHDVLEAIFIRVGEAWEVLGDARSRKSYEARFSPGVRAHPDSGTGGGEPAAGPADSEAQPYVPTDETLATAQILLAQARYWDAIQMLEFRLPLMPPSKQQRRGRILLARAYAKNPNWLRKAEDALQQVVREEPGNADAHYELGLLYKAGGMLARAHASFRRVLELRPDHREAAAELGVKPPAAAGPPPGGLLKRLFGRGKAS